MFFPVVKATPLLKEFHVTELASGLQTSMHFVSERLRLDRASFDVSLVPVPR